MKVYPFHSINWYFIIGVIFLITLATLLGNKRNKLLSEDLISTSLSKLSGEVNYINSNKWEVISPKTKSYKYYIYIGEGKGYNGPIKVMVVADTNYTIDSIQILAHSETYSYFQQIAKHNFLNKLNGKALTSIKHTDGISGATISSKGIIRGINSAYALGEDLSLSEEKKVHFGFLEIIITMLYALALINVKLRKRLLVKTVWWVSLFLSIIFIGFIYNQPITTARINSFLLGYWPSIYTELSVYILVFGSVISILFTGKNHYCHSICPFGVSQDALGKIGNAKNRRPKSYNYLKRIQWSVTLLVILIALFMHNPGITEYEIYGGLFKLTATAVGFSLLFIVVVSSLFIKRPWCQYLCPLDGVFKYFSLIRQEVKKLYKK